MLVLGPVDTPEADVKADWFVAGGISGCPDWQSELISLVSETNLVLANPRRSEQIDLVSDIAVEQITWEHKMLRSCSGILFWFPEETLCPITLFELGSALERFSTDQLRVGAHANYKRRLDLEVQIALSGHDLSIVDSVAELASSIIP